MKPEIHPRYYRTKVTCACGATYEVGSTKESMRVDVCAHCHPFYTGQQRLAQTGGRVERYRRRFAKAMQSTAPAAGQPEA